MSFNKVKLRALRASIFMDHRNIFKEFQKMKEFKNYMIDYRRLRRILLKDFKSAGAFAFLGVHDPIPPEKELFMRYLEKSGWTPLWRELMRKRDGTYIQQGLDTFMILEIEHLISTFDTAILVTGDVHFVILVELLKSSLKDVQVWSWKESMSRALLKEAGKDNVFYINNIWDKIKQKRKRNDPGYKTNN